MCRIITQRNPGKRASRVGSSRARVATYFSRSRSRRRCSICSSLTVHRPRSVCVCVLICPGASFYVPRLKFIRDGRAITAWMRTCYADEYCYRAERRARPLCGLLVHSVRGRSGKTLAAPLEKRNGEYPGAASLISCLRLDFPAQKSASSPALESLISTRNRSDGALPSGFPRCRAVERAIVSSAIQFPVL